MERKKLNTGMGIFRNLFRSRTPFKSHELVEIVNSQDLEIKKLKDTCYSLEFEKLQNEEHLSTLEKEKEENERLNNYEKSILNQNLQQVKKENDRLSKKLTVLGDIPELPSNLSSVVELMEQVQSDRLVFLPESKKSSKESKFQDVCPSWSLLWKMSTILWSLVFEKELDKTSIEKEFKNQTSFELTFSEGKQTNRDSKFRELRKRTYLGKEVDITPHCKVDKSKGMLRIHFYLDYERKLIVVGHCGNHLENYMSLGL